MPFALELSFDDHLDVSVRRIWDALARAGVPAPLGPANARPHVSLGVAQEVDARPLLQALPFLAATTAPVHVVLAHIGVFAGKGGVVFLGVAPTAALLRLHADLWAAFGTHARRPFATYAPGAWIPHCTLTHGGDPAAVAHAVQVVASRKLPLVGRTAFLGLVDAGPNRVVEMARYPMG